MTVPLSAMGPPHATKRLPSPATHATPAPSSTQIPKLRSRRCLPSLPRRLRPPQVYRTVSAAVLIATPVLLLARYIFSAARIAPSPLLPDIPDTVLQLRRFSRRALRLYQRQLHLHPLLSRGITAGIIFFIADLLAQMLNRRSSKAAPVPFSLRRLARYTGYGLLLIGPFLYLWYALMNEYGPEDDLRGSLLKCIFEQITLEPICISMYIIYDGIVCRRGLRAVRSTLDAQFFPLWFKNAIFWLPANFANYYIGTPDLRVVFANLCSLFWNIYFSAKVNKIAVPSFASDKDSAKYLPLSNHDRDGQSVTTSASYQLPSDSATRRTGDSVSSSRLSTKTLIV